jgi:hypothetical protein
MEKSKLRQIAGDYLLPFFSGATLGTPVTSTSGQATVAFAGLCEIQFKINRRDKYRLRMQRSQPFEQRAGGGITEFRVVQAFVYIVRQIEDSLTGRYGSDLLASFQRRIVARATGGSSNGDTVLLAIDELASWATRLYEGRPIAAAIGLAPINGRPDVTLKDICKEPFSPVLSNGFDTLLCFDFDGRFSGYYSLSAPHSPPT